MSTFALLASRKRFFDAYQFSEATCLDDSEQVLSEKGLL